MQAIQGDLGLVKDLLNKNLETQKAQDQYMQQLQEFYRKEMKSKTPLDKARDEFNEYKAKLKPTDVSESSFQRNKKVRSAGTCEWVFKEPRYKEWHDSDEDTLLWISGIRGMGKSGMSISRIYGP